MSVAQTIAVPRTLAVRQVNTRSLIGLALALAGAALVLWLYRGQQPQTFEVLWAARDVPAGTVLRADDLVPTSEALPEHLATTLAPASERQALVGRTLAQPLNAGELVTRRQAVPALLRIPEGQRVYTIPVNPETAAGGQLEAGDEVQVVVTLNKARPDEAQTRTVIERAAVYAVGRQDASSTVFAAEDTSDAGPGRLAWLALLLDDAQFQALAKARWTGDIDVALLPPARGDR